MPRRVTHPSDSTFTASPGQGHTLVLMAMSVGKLLCLLRILETFFDEDAAPKRPKRPAPKFEADRPTGHSPYIILTQLGAGAVAVLIKACEDFQVAFMADMEVKRAEQEKRKAELGPQPETGRRVLFPALPDRHPLVDEYLIFLRQLYAPRENHEPSEGAHLLAQVRQLAEPYMREP